MSFSRVNPGGWAVGATLTSAQQNALDVDHANAADKTTLGDTISGQWTFSAATAGLVFGNSSLGIGFSAGTGVVVNFGSGLRTITGSGVDTLNAGASLKTNGGTISLGAGPTDIKITGGNTRSPVQPMVVFQYTSGWASGGSAGVISALSAPATTQVIAIPIWPHNGATIASITMFLGVVNHANVPAFMPSMAVKRNTIVNNGQYIPVDLSTTANQAFPTPGSGAAWTDSNAQQSWTYTANQNNVVDRTQYNYWIQLTDENGTNSVAGNQYWGFIIAYTAIPDMRFP